jgi:hypothetical protein
MCKQRRAAKRVGLVKKETVVNKILKHELASARSENLINSIANIQEEDEDDNE